MLHTDVADGIHRIDEAFTNWYLVEEDGDVTVVDTGFPRSWGTLRSALQTLGRSTDDVKAVVLTHGHFDHMGFAERARSELGVPVYAHAKEIPVTRHPWRYDHERSRVRYMKNPGHLRILGEMSARGALWVGGTQKVRVHDDGDVLDVPGHPRVVFTPGHTHGHCSLHFPERDALIAGDAIVMLDPYTARTGPQIVSGAATADSGQALASLERIAETGATTVLTGHGEPWTQGAQLAAERARAAGPS